MMEIIQRARLTIDKQYTGEDIWIRFTDPDSNSTYQYPHNELIGLLKENAPSIFNTVSWERDGHYNWRKIPKGDRKSKYLFLIEFLSRYQI